MENGENRVRRHICFYGQVQGVGFRYRAMQLASYFGLTGWVRNEDDYVEMEVQGTEEAIDRLIHKIDENSWIVIEHMESKRIPLQEERDFRITW